MSARLEPGIAFGRYVLLRRLAVGGMAEVWLARPADGGGKPVVLKRILPQFATDPEFVGRFREEASLTLSLVHGNIVPVFEVGAVGEETYIAMEHVPGHDLRSVLRRARERGKAAPAGVAATIAAEVLRGLEYAHRKTDSEGRRLELVHRDVSPSNVVVSNEGTVKLLDFGIAKALGRAEATRTGVLRGKVGYMSPEQARGEPIGATSDLFSTGVVLWELLTADRLFDGDSELAVLEKVKAAVIPSVRERNPFVPASLEKIVTKALARDAADRFPDAGAFLAELVRFQLDSPVGAGPDAVAAFVRDLFPEASRANDPELDAYTATHAPSGGGTGTAAPAGAAAPARLLLGGDAGSPSTSSPRAADAARAGARAWMAGLGVVAVVAVGVALLVHPRGATTGELYVATRNVTGAAVWIDGSFTGVTTPGRVAGLSPGAHVLDLKLDDYLPMHMEHVLVDAGQQHDVEETLILDERTIQVISDPPHALVTVAGASPCIAPCSFSHLRPSQSVQVTAENGPLPSDTALTVSYQGNREEGFDLHGGGATNVDVCCRAGSAWSPSAALPAVACSGTVLSSVSNGADAARRDAAADASLSDAATPDASIGDAASEPHEEAGLPDAILCELWTNGPAEIAATATGYAPLDEMRQAELLSNGCGVQTLDVRLVLQHPDASP